MILIVYIYVYSTSVSNNLIINIINQQIVKLYIKYVEVKVNETVCVVVLLLIKNKTNKKLTVCNYCKSDSWQLIVYL